MSQLIMADGFMGMHLRDTVMIAPNTKVRILTALDKLQSIFVFVSDICLHPDVWWVELNWVEMVFFYCATA